MMNIDKREWTTEPTRPSPGSGQYEKKEHQAIKARNLFSIRTGGCHRQLLLELARFFHLLSPVFKGSCPAIETQSGDRLKVKRAADQSGAGPAGFRGFSLVETLLAMAIAFFLLVGLAQMLCYSLLLKQKGDLYQVSADLISRKLELLKSLSPENEALTPGLHQETIHDSKSGRLFLLNWEVSQNQDDLKKIQLSLYPAPFGLRPPVKACWLKSESLGF